MGYLIDGFNLIYKFPHLEGMMYRDRLNEARRGLIEILKQYQHIKKADIRVVFDGRKNPGDSIEKEQIGPIRIYYSHDYSADYIIKEFIKIETNPRMTQVVTSDRDIIFYVNRFRAPVIKSEDFARLVNKEIEGYNRVYTPEKEIDPHLSDEEISYWEELFKKNKG